MIKWLLAIGFAWHCALATGAPQTIKSGGYQFYVDDIPAWVKSITPPDSQSGGEQTDAVKLELLDMQLVVHSGEFTTYRMMVFRALNQAGVEDVSHFPIDFNSQLQTLSLHGVWVTHKGKRTSRFDASSVRLTESEPDIDKRIYRGIVSAAIVIKDVKVGDRVEVSYSITERNPLLAAHFSHTFPLGASASIDLLRVRLLAPASRQVRMKVLNSSAQPTVSTIGSETETVFLLRNTTAIATETQVPPASAMGPVVQFSEFDSWEAVGEWAQSLFSRRDPVPTALAARVQSWQQQAGSPEEAARLALDYVQKEIRYVSVALGESSFRPESPDRVAERGFGDCKDKSILLVTLLRAMDVTASPVLVSTKWKEAAFDWLPDVAPLDHMVVLAEINGRSKYWLDGTDAFQAGAIAFRSIPNYGKVLVVRDQSPTVESIDPPADLYMTTAIHRYAVRKYSEPIEFSITARHRGMFASYMRMLMETQQSEYVAQIERMYRTVFPELEAVPERSHGHSDEQTGEFVTEMHFRIPDFFKYKPGALAGETAPLGLVYELRPIASRGRKHAVALTYPKLVVVDVVVEFPEEIPTQTSTEPKSISDDFVSLHVLRTYDDKKLTAHYEFKTLAPSIPAKELSRHNELLGTMQRWISVDFSVPLAAGNSAPPDIAQPAPTSSIVKLLAKAADQEARYSAEIASGRLTDAQLSAAYLSRAWSREHQGKFEEALTDARRAAELDPKSGKAIETTAGNLVMLKRFDEARGQYALAGASMHDDYELLMGRGRLNYYSGRFADAQADFRNAVGAADADGRSYALIWLYLATAQVGLNPSKELEPYVEAQSTQWPRPAIDLLMGKLTLDAFYDAARDRDEDLALLQSCEAHFFAGQYHLLRGDKNEAKTAFEQSVATDVRAFIEYVASQWELERLNHPE